MLKKNIKLIIKYIDFIIPKNKNRWVFFLSHQVAWDANMQAVFVLASQKSSLQCVVCYLRPGIFPRLKGGQKIVSFKSFYGLWQCLRAGVIIFDHALAPGIGKMRRKCVNLWHGIPIKTIRYFDEDIFPKGYLEEQSSNTSMVICSSLIDRLAMSSSLQIRPSRVKITGLPRVDILLEPQKFIPFLADLQRDYKSLKDLKKDKKLVLYAPTYRGAVASPEVISEGHNIDEGDLAKVLIKRGAILGVRPHPFSKEVFFPELQKQGLAVNLSSDSFSNTSLLLHFVDILISDYSSVWIDFLLTKRPIIGFWTDFDEYFSQRGFLYDFKSIFPGEITTTLPELAKCLDDGLTKGLIFEKKYEKALWIFYEYNDSLNSERVVDLIENNCI